MGKDMIIVGAGIAGLSAGFYARLNGYKTTIYEMHAIPGGLCTAWKRKGYTFDISMHMVVGSKSGPIHRMWQELGVTKNHSFHYHTEASRIEGLEKSLSFCTDPDRLLEQLLSISPADEKLSREFVRLVSGSGIMGAMSLKPSEISGVGDKLKLVWTLLPHLRRMSRYGKKLLHEFTNRFQDPFLRDAVRFLMDSPDWPMPDCPLVALSGMLRSAVAEAGVPLGGSKKVAFRIAEQFRELGGEIVCSRRVKDIIIERNRAAGIRLEDGTERRADRVVWAADGHTAIFDILGGRYADDRIRKMYVEWRVVQPLAHVMLGVARDLSRQPFHLIFELEKPVLIAGRQRSWLTLRHHCFDPSMAPPGKSAAEIWYPTPYEYWKKLAVDRKEYEDEKRRIAEATIAELDRRWPGFASDIEVVDVATPNTYVRYTGNWKGSPDGWYVTPENMMNQSPLRELPGLSAFYMVGQWTAPFTGTVIAALTGRQLIELLCRRDGRPFAGST